MKKFWFLIFILIFFACGTKRSATNSSHSNIQEKYSRMLGVSEKEISNQKLYSFIDEWYGTKYEYGGKSKKGIDCSGFVSVLSKEVFGKEIRGTSASIYEQCEKIPERKLQEGDLVFFKIDSKEISHIGIYLQNNKFVHASTHKGVMIDDLNEEYYKKYFFTGGMLK